MRPRIGAVALLGLGVSGACALPFPEYELEEGSSGATSTSSAETANGPLASSATATASTVDASSSVGGGRPTTTAASGGGAGGGGGEREGGEAGGAGGTTSSAGGAGPCFGAPDGPIGGLDDPGDCRDHHCLGGEEIDEADDDEDPPDAAPPCELTICVDGVPTPHPADAGMECGAPPLECDGLGHCAGCAPDGSDSQCGSATSCSSPTCEESGVCDPGFLDDTTLLPDAVDGDCKRSVCSGAAVDSVEVDDDEDEPPNPVCAAAVCVSGAVDFTRLNEGAPCFGQAGVCDGAGDGAASCKSCRDTAAAAGLDAGCGAASPVCEESANGGLGQCLHCADDATGAATDSGCPSAQVCQVVGLGVCVACYTDPVKGVINCPSGEVCDPAGTGECVGCYDAGDGIVDAGCSAPEPACDETAVTCVECQSQADCAGNLNGPLCNRASETACGCTAAGDCAASNQGHLCSKLNVCSCKTIGDCGGIPGVSGCTDNVCMCGGSPC